MVLDARTLAEQRRFGAALFAGMTGSLALEVVGEELYVVSSLHGRIHVFSFAGEHLRDIIGDWREAVHILHHNHRLYLIENDGEDEEAVENEPDVDPYDEDTWPEEKKRAGKRIFVLTPQGETLQVWKPPAEDQTVLDMAVFGRKLIVALEKDHQPYPVADRFVALKGV